MVKLSGFIGRKVPIPGIAFSSQSCSAGMEVELSDTESPEAARQRLRRLYALLREAVEEQLAAGEHSPVAQPTPPPADTVVAPAAPPVSTLAAPPNSLPASPPVRLPAERLPAAQSSTPPTDGNGNGGGNGKEPPTKATRAQQRAIHAICKNLGLDPALLLLDYGVVNAADLTIKDASRLIDDLKFRQANDLACG